jgi:hypothetical protein
VKIPTPPKQVSPPPVSTGYTCRNAGLALRSEAHLPPLGHRRLVSGEHAIADERFVFTAVVTPS